MKEMVKIEVALVYHPTRLSTTDGAQALIVLLLSFTMSGVQTPYSFLFMQFS